MGHVAAAGLVVVMAAGMAGAAPLAVRYDDDGMITVNGQRTLIVGSYYAAKSDKPYADMAEAGFNLIRTDSSAEEMDQALAAGLMTWTSVGTIDMADREASTARLLEKVRAIKDHPALAFVESVDEPAWTWMKAETRVPAQPFVEAYPLIKEADPNHLMYMNHAPTNLVKTMQAYNPGTDIVACDIYPVNPGGLRPMYALFEDGHQGDLNNQTISQVGDYVDKMRQVTGPNRPLFMVLQAFAWEALREEKERDESKVLYPTWEESRFMAFQSLIKGANGIIYWGSYTMPQPSDAWTGITRVTREVADLAAVLSQRAARFEPTVEYHEIGHSVDDGVQWLVKESGGALYVFTCNAYRYPCRATLGGFSGWKTCTVINENRAIEIAENGVTDDWNAFDVHLYRFEK
ncbi:MAG TPA: hypothetical protein PLM14_13735 [Candidatus Hydrogenedentes bacterium]|nr:hypothetical protein [Candidatus Hydrogenedentota bacterium]HQH53153.1 hypothetical protein [Candidatus Hydrogenedentota bacterium]